MWCTRHAYLGDALALHAEALDGPVARRQRVLKTLGDGALVEVLRHVELRNKRKQQGVSSLCESGRSARTVRMAPVRVTVATDHHQLAAA